MSTDNDRTESLLEENPTPTKGKSKRNLIIIIVGIVAILLIGGGVYGYNFYKDSQYQKYLELGQNYLNDGDYEQAILAFDQAINIDSKQIPAYEYKIEAALDNGDTQLAKETYEALYNVTNNQLYKAAATQVMYGNYIGNLSNGDFIASSGDSDYMIYQDGTNASIYKVTDGENTKLLSVPYEQNYFTFYLHNISLWGSDLYYFQNYDLVKYNVLNDKKLNTGISGTNRSTTTSSYENVYSVNIYDGSLYYAKSTYGSTTSVNGTYAIYKADLAGDNEELFYSSPSLIGNFFIYNEKAYLFEYNMDSTDLRVFDMNSKSIISSKTYGYDSGLLCANSENAYIYINEGNGNSGIYKIDGTDTELVYDLSNTQDIISSVNCDENYIYFLQGKNLNRVNLEGEDFATIGTVDDSSYNLYYFTEYSDKCINVSQNYIYLRFSGAPEYQSDMQYHYYRVSKDDYTDFSRFDPES